MSGSPPQLPQLVQLANGRQWRMGKQKHSTSNSFKTISNIKYGVPLVLLLVAISTISSCSGSVHKSAAMTPFLKSLPADTPLPTFTTTTTTATANAASRSSTYSIHSNIHSIQEGEDDDEEEYGIYESSPLTSALNRASSSKRSSSTNSKLASSSNSRIINNNNNNAISSKSSPATTTTTTNTSSSSPSTTTTISSTTQTQLSTTPPIRVAYQGEPGAYSEKSLRELLGPNVHVVPRPDFESCYRAVATREVDYACLPVENSLGGSIHENYDLMLRYDLTIVAEHECRVSHCLHAVHGVQREDIQYCMSHPQALKQCDNYLRGLKITPVPMYDTAGSAKLLADHYAKSNGNGADTTSTKSSTKSTEIRALPDKCTWQNTAAIASDLAGKVYGLNCIDKGIEDDDTNFTRFLLLGRKGVSQYLNKKIPSKTSIVFTLPNTPGALYKALACFSLRDIDFSKIESRPTSASLLNYLKFKNTVMGKKKRNQADLPRFRYTFYLDFLANELDENAQNALHHLREQADFCRILGSYPQKSKLVGFVKDEVDHAASITSSTGGVGSTISSLPSDEYENELKTSPLNIGIIGFGAFGQHLASKMTQHHRVRCIDNVDKAQQAEQIGAEFYPIFEMTKFLRSVDVLILAVPLIDFESTITSLTSSTPELLRNKLIVDVCPLSVHPKQVLQQNLPPDVDILCTNPMFGPASESSPKSWNGSPLLYDKVRIRDELRCDRFLRFFESCRCQMVQMTAEQQDAHTADAEFVTHLTGRLLSGKNMLPPTPVTSKEYAALCDVADMTSGDTFDLFYGMYKFNEHAQAHVVKMRENLARVERQLAAKEAYLAASVDMRNSDRQRLIAECKQLMREVASKSMGTTTTTTTASSSESIDK